MSLPIPTVMIALLLIAWLAQMRLCANMDEQDYHRERLITRYGGLACLIAALAITVVKFF
jgi:hypothetical protein